MNNKVKAQKGGEIDLFIIGLILNIPFFSDYIKILCVQWYIYAVSIFAKRWEREEEKEIRRQFSDAHLSQLMTETGRSINEYTIDIYCSRDILRLRFKNGKPHGIYLKYARRSKDIGSMKVCLRIVMRVKDFANHKVLWKLAKILTQYEKVNVKQGVCLFNNPESPVKGKIWANYKCQIPGLSKEADDAVLQQMLADEDLPTRTDEAYFETDVENPSDYANILLGISNEDHSLKEFFSKIFGGLEKIPSHALKK